MDLPPDLDRSMRSEIDDKRGCFTLLTCHPIASFLAQR